MLALRTETDNESKHRQNMLLVDIGKFTPEVHLARTHPLPHPFSMLSMLLPNRFVEVLLFNSIQFYSYDHTHAHTSSHSDFSLAFNEAMAQTTGYIYTIFIPRNSEQAKARTGGKRARTLPIHSTRRHKHKSATAGGRRTVNHYDATNTSKQHAQ